MNYLNSCICYFYYYFNITISFIRNINNYSVTHIKTRQLGSVCPNSGVTVQHVSPGLNRIAPFKYAYSLVLMSNPQHFLRNILIPWTSVNATPLLLLWLSCLSCPLVKIRCNMLGSCVSEVSKSILSCAMPSTSSGAAAAPHQRVLVIHRQLSETRDVLHELQGLDQDRGGGFACGLRGTERHLPLGSARTRAHGHGESRCPRLVPKLRRLSVVL